MFQGRSSEMTGSNKLIYMLLIYALMLLKIEETNWNLFDLNDVPNHL